jgi:tetratricopeptide (TPR) repeat protein
MRARRRDARPCLVGCVLVALLAGCSSSSRQLLDQAEASWRKGRYPEAIQANLDLYNREQHGKYAAGALLKIGNIYYLNLRQVKQAIEFYDKLTREFPDSQEALQARRQLAAIYVNEVIDLDQAIAQYDRLLEAEDLDDRPEILLQRADAYFKKEEYDRALRELRSLEDSGISGDLADQVSLKIGDIYQIQKKFEEALEPFRKAAGASSPECRRRAILNLAETYENLFEFDKAIEAIRMLDKTPENEVYIEHEVERVNARRKQVEKGGGLEWDQRGSGDNEPRKRGKTAKLAAEASFRRPFDPSIEISRAKEGVCQQFHDSYNWWVKAAVA